VITDLAPDWDQLTSTPQMCELELSRQGKLWCWYYGAVDAAQRALLEQAFTVREKAPDERIDRRS